ncbi:hypothetical protein [Nonomuraea insulae]|uniref:Uncharacterized protein n=1 Tax=Nonomuraea insulae TaxID=1616787 RepID=A0ABW1DEI7_9ACTN
MVSPGGVVASGGWGVVRARCRGYYGVLVGRVELSGPVRAWWFRRLRAGRVSLCGVLGSWLVVRGVCGAGLSMVTGLLCRLICGYYPGEGRTAPGL